MVGHLFELEFKRRLNAAANARGPGQKFVQVGAGGEEEKWEVRAVDRVSWEGMPPRGRRGVKMCVCVCGVRERSKQQTQGTKRKAEEGQQGQEQEREMRKGCSDVFSCV